MDWITAAPEGVAIAVSGDYHTLPAGVRSRKGQGEVVSAPGAEAEGSLKSEAVL